MRQGTRLRTRLIALGGTLAAALLGVVMLAAPASAHTLEVSGTTTCAMPDHVISWTIHNHETLSTRTMTIARLSATVDGVEYPVTGFSDTIPPNGNTTASTTVPGSVNGTITLTVHAVWADGFRATAEGSVLLLPACPDTTTTSSTTPTPSSTPVTSTPASGPGPSSSGPAPTTASTLPPGSGVLGIQAGPTTSTPSSGALPFTGARSTLWALIGIGAFVVGLALVAGPGRRKPATRR